jgi:hypothetical protein
MVGCHSKIVPLHKNARSAWSMHANPELKMIARQKDSGFGWKLEDFEFRAAFTIIQHFHFFEKNI